MDTFEITVLLIVISVLIYKWLTWNQNYWKNLNIEFLEPQLFFGNVKESTLMKKSPGDVYFDLYSRSDKPAVGVFKMRQPQLLVRDPELVKIFLVNEFSNFHDNAYYTEPNDFFYSKHPFFLTGDSWKKARGMSTPALTPGKVKILVPQILSVCQEAVNYFNENQDKSIEVRQFSSQYTTDTIISCAYGLNSNAIRDPDSEYRVAIEEVFLPDWWGSFKFTLSTMIPWVGRLFKIGITPKSFVKFYTSVVEETVNYRKTNSIKRNDFLQHLINISGKDGNPEMSTYDMTAYSMIMIADGVDTSGVCISHFLDLLSRHPDVQVKLRQEFEENIGNVESITYENINSLPYLNATFCECLRLRTPVPLLEKVCTKDTEICFKGYKYSLTKGTVFALCLDGIHMDPKYFDDPELFKPERFLDNPNNPAFIPFGLGPRACLGKLFGTMQVKLFIAVVLSNFEIIPVKKGVEVKFDEKSTFLKSLKDDYRVYLKKIQ